MIEAEAGPIANGWYYDKTARQWERYEDGAIVEMLTLEWLLLLQSAVASETERLQAFWDAVADQEEDDGYGHGV